MCENGNGKEQLCNSHGLCVDNTNGNIDVADQLNNCIKVFSSCGEFLFKFSDTGDEGKMSFPRGLAIWGDRIVITSGVTKGTGAPRRFKGWALACELRTARP